MSCKTKKLESSRRKDRKTISDKAERHAAEGEEEKGGRESCSRTSPYFGVKRVNFFQPVFLGDAAAPHRYNDGEPNNTNLSMGTR